MSKIGDTLDATFHYYIDRWRLTPEGNAIVTRTSRLLPVRWQGAAAILKVAVDAEEERGNHLMAWWEGQGVPLVLAREGKAVLLERAQDEGSLANLVRDGRDDEATGIICAVVAKLHLPRSQPIPTLVPRSEWFRELAPAAEAYGGILSLSVATAHELLAAPGEIGVLHGDIHHDNILRFGGNGSYQRALTQPLEWRTQRPPNIRSSGRHWFVVRALIALLAIAESQTRDTVDATSSLGKKMLLARHRHAGAERCLEQLKLRTAEALTRFGRSTDRAMIFDQQETAVSLHFELRHIAFDGSQPG